jgi:hypothetical protein
MGEHERGVTATLQRQSVVRFAVAQPSRAGVKRPEVTQFVLAQAGKDDRLTRAELSFVGTVDVSRERIPGLGTAATRLIVAIVNITREAMMRVGEWFEGDPFSVVFRPNKPEMAASDILLRLSVARKRSLGQQKCRLQPQPSLFVASWQGSPQVRLPHLEQHALHVKV